MAPRVGISACLLGHRVRYDGGHKRQELIIDRLGSQVEWVPVCPEEGAGFGTPREPIHLEQTPVGLRLLGNDTGTDRTDAMAAYAAAQIERLRAAGIAGFIFKARSPSCALDDAPQQTADGVVSGAGMFAKTLRAAMPNLPTADEEELRSIDGLNSFMARVFEKGKRSDRQEI